jgi:hypothetical protein
MPERERVAKEPDAFKLPHTCCSARRVALAPITPTISVATVAAIAGSAKRLDLALVFLQKPDHDVSDVRFVAVQISVAGWKDTDCHKFTVGQMLAQFVEAPASENHVGGERNVRAISHTASSR